MSNVKPNLCLFLFCFLLYFSFLCAGLLMSFTLAQMSIHQLRTFIRKCPSGRERGWENGACFIFFELLGWCPLWELVPYEDCVFCIQGAAVLSGKYIPQTVVQEEVMLVLQESLKTYLFIKPIYKVLIQYSTICCAILILLWFFIDIVICCYFLF